MDQKRRFKRIARLHALRDRVAEWAARHHGQELEDGMRCYLGTHEPEQDMVLNAVAFALLAPPPGQPSLLQRFAASTTLGHADRRVLQSWSQSWLVLGEVVGLEPGHVFVVEDVVTGQQHEVVDIAASRQLQVGQWWVMVLMPTDGHIESEGTTAYLTSTARIGAVQAYLSGAEALDLDLSLSRDPATRQLARGVLHAVRKTQRRPRLLNHDREPMELVSADLGVDWPRVLAEVQTWEDASVDEADRWAALLGRFSEAMQGPLVLARFYEEGGKVRMWANSRARFERACALWQERAGEPLPVLEQTVDTPESDPEGPEMLTDHVISLEQEQLTEQEFAERAMRRWADEAIPALDGLSPRQALAAGRHVEVRALLPDGQPALRKDLGL